MKKCPTCKGVGVRHGAWVINWPCHGCKGLGVVPDAPPAAGQFTREAGGKP